MPCAALTSKQSLPGHASDEQTCPLVRASKGEDVAAGERDVGDPQEAHITPLGNFAVPVARLSTFLFERISPATLVRAKSVWEQRW
jgi:hypothetical protein